MNVSKAKTSRQEFELIDETTDNHPSKMAQTPTNDESSQSANSNEEILSTESSAIQYIDVGAYACQVTFSSIQTIANSQGISRWEAKLKHSLYDTKKSAVLAKTMFHLIDVKHLSNFSVDLKEAVDTETYFYKVLFIEGIDIPDMFRGFDYGVCLVQRIIDNHARSDDVVVVEYVDLMQDICDKMQFDPTPNERFWHRSMEYEWRDLRKIAKCHQQDSSKQIVNERLLCHYTKDEHDEPNEEKGNPEVEYDDIDTNYCFVKFSVKHENATNYQLEEDYTSSWSAKMVYEPPNVQQEVTLATARFWFIHRTRLMNDGCLSKLHYILDVPCQELADLSSVMNVDGYFEPFKVCEQDALDLVKIRLSNSKDRVKSNIEEMGVTEEEFYEGLARAWKGAVTISMWSKYTK